MPADSADARYKDREIVFANGAKGRTIEISTAAPSGYHQLITAPNAMPRLSIDGKLFIPPVAGSGSKLPLVMIVPGSLGVAPSHVGHAETLCNEGFATFVLDPFGARGVTSTVSNQTSTPGPRALTMFWRHGTC